MNKRYFPVLAAVLIVAAVGISILVFLYGRSVRRQAGSLLNDIQRITDSQDPTEAFTIMRAQYGKRMQLSGCGEPGHTGAVSEYRRGTSVVCVYDVVVSNNELAKLHVVPYTEMHARFDVLDGKIEDTTIDYRVAREHEESPTVFVQTDLCRSQCTYFYVDPWSKSGVTGKHGSIQMASHSRADLRRIAMALNLECFSKLGGCSEINDLLPTVWERTGNGTIRCRIENVTGSVAQ